MEVYEAIRKRRTIRIFKKKASEEQLKKIILAGTQAPSAGNSQPWEFIIIDDQKVIDQITIAVGCYPAMKKEAERPEEALKQVRLFSPKFHDDMDIESLTLAIRRNLEYLERLNPETVFHYGPHDFTIQQMPESQEVFLDLLSKGFDAHQLSRETRKKFRGYQATGRVGNRKVLFTGYYEPIYEGSLIQF